MVGFMAWGCLHDVKQGVFVSNVTCGIATRNGIAHFRPQWNRRLQRLPFFSALYHPFFNVLMMAHDCPCLIKSHLLVVKSQLVSGFKHCGGSLFAMIPTFVSRGIETTRGSNHGHHGADARTSKAVRRACHDDGNCLEHRASQDLWC